MKSVQIEMKKCKQCKTYVFVRDFKENICRKCNLINESELSKEDIQKLGEEDVKKD